MEMHLFEEITVCINHGSSMIKLIFALIMPAVMYISSDS